MSWSRREALVGLGAAVAGCAARQVPRRVLTCEDVDPTLSRADCRALTGDQGHVEADAEGSVELRALLVEHARRYPRMEPADVFKLCHQRRMGPGHMVDAGDALAWLQREASELAPLPEGVDDVDVELLDPGRGLARVHLRPWLAQGKSLEVLATAFSETAARWVQAPEALAADLDLVAELLAQGALPLAFDRAAWEAFTAPLVAQGLPAVHHSEVYQESYAPAYRVVLVELITGDG